MVTCLVSRELALVHPRLWYGSQRYLLYTLPVWLSTRLSWARILAVLQDMLERLLFDSQTFLSDRQLQRSPLTYFQLFQRVRRFMQD